MRNDYHKVVYNGNGHPCHKLMVGKMVKDTLKPLTELPGKILLGFSVGFLLILWYRNS